LLRSAVSDSAANLFAFVPALGTGEALVFGVGAPLPTRLTFTELPPQLLPRSEAYADDPANQLGSQGLNFIASVVERWRGATMRRRVAANEPERDAKPTVGDALQSPPPEPEPSRFSLLKKPLADKPDPYAALRSPAAARANR
jgi:hypothetical protein